MGFMQSRDPQGPSKFHVVFVVRLLMFSSR
jgi:hypothetical protein